MRVQSAVLAGLLCLFTLSAAADITAVRPSVIPLLGSGEPMTIVGTGLLGTQSTTVVFDGIYEVEASSASSTDILVFVPIDVTAFGGEHTLEVRSYDQAGIRVHGPVTFLVESQPGDAGPPLLNLPESIVVEADTARGAEVRYVASAISASTGDPVPVSCSPASETIFAMGTTAVQCTATDEGGTAVSGFTVFVTDTTPPELTVPADIESANPVVTFTATAVDNIDGAVPVTCSPASGSTFPAGRTKVICTATDAHQNLALDAFFVRTTGGPPPLSVPGNLFVEATSAAGAVVDFADEVIAEDATSVVCTPPSGSTFALGGTTVTCTATNAAGSTSASFVITVTDNTGPVLNIPTVLEVEATSPAGANATYTATANDAVDGSRTVDCVPASGTFFAFGTTAVYCTSVDTRGNSTDGSFDVVVQDTTGPTITVATANPGSLWPPNHRMVPVTVTVQATDAVDPTPSIHILSVSSNQPVDGTGDGDTGPDWVITSPLTVELRAERSGNSERIYTIRVSATDLYGNVSTADVTVRVAQSKKGAALR